MDKQRRYTVQEIRAVAEDTPICVGYDYGNRRQRLIRDMLRQAADTEEELVKLNESKNRWMQYQETAAGERNACIDELRKKDAEIAQLKARLETVVKECEKWKWADDNWCTSVKDATDTHNKCIDRIRRAAEGEGSANA